MDSNLISSVNSQHEPVDMPKFLQALKSGADHAVGNRFQHTKKPKSPRNPRPRLRPPIRCRDRNKLPTQKSQNRRNTNHGEVPRSIKQGKPLTPRTQPPLVNTMDRPHKKTDSNINTRRDLPNYIHYVVHTHHYHIQRNKIHQTNLHNAGNTSRNRRCITNINKSHNPATKTTNNTMGHVN